MAMPWGEVPTPTLAVTVLVTVSITETAEMQPGAGSSWIQYLQAVVPSMIRALYSEAPPPLPSKSSAPYQPVIPLPAPTFTLQPAFRIALPEAFRHTDSP